MGSKQKIIYFLRGMGVGLFLSGCVFAIFSKDTKKPVVSELSKEEIMTAAKEYGMVEGMDAKLNELKNQVTTAPTTPVPTITPATSKDTGVEKESPAPKDKEAEKKPATPQPTIIPSESVQFEIVPGDNGKTVSQKLEDAGIVKSASKFNSYLQKYDHAKKIKIGTYELNQSDSYYEIAIAITGK